MESTSYVLRALDFSVRLFALMIKPDIPCPKRTCSFVKLCSHPRNGVTIDLVPPHSYPEGGGFLPNICCQILLCPSCRHSSIRRTHYSFVKKRQKTGIWMLCGVVSGTNKRKAEGHVGVCLAHPSVRAAEPVWDFPLPPEIVRHGEC